MVTWVPPWAWPNNKNVWHIIEVIKAWKLLFSIIDLRNCFEYHLLNNSFNTKIVVLIKWISNYIFIIKIIFPKIYYHLISITYFVFSVLSSFTPTKYGCKSLKKMQLTAPWIRLFDLCLLFLSSRNSMLPRMIDWLLPLYLILSLFLIFCVKQTYTLLHIITRSCFSISKVADVFQHPSVETCNDGLLQIWPWRNYT